MKVAVLMMMMMMMKMMMMMMMRMMITTTTMDDYSHRTVSKLSHSLRYHDTIFVCLWFLMTSCEWPLQL